MPRKSRTCAGQGCQKRGSNVCYGVIGVAERYCSPCAKMVWRYRRIPPSQQVVPWKKCTRCNETPPRYGYDDQPYLWCRPCAEIEWHDRKIDKARRCDATRKCTRCNETQPNYGYDDQPYLWCRPCAEIEWHDRKIDEARRCDANKKCTRCNETIPNYGYDDQPHLWCRPCAEIEWHDRKIDEARRCDAHQKCTRCKKTLPSYGYDDQPRLWCRPCAEIEWHDRKIDETRRCDAQQKCILCNEHAPNYGYDDQSRLWCRPCAEIEWEDRKIDEGRRKIPYTLCPGAQGHQCEQKGNPKYDGYCTFCFKNMFPGDPRVNEIRQKTKELRWVNALMTCTSDLDLDWVHDRPIYVDFSGGCCPSRRRIDLRVLVTHPTRGIFWLCIEVDEDQHRAYPDGYETARYDDLFMDFSGRYVFLRINPDPFRDGSGARMDPPFEERLSVVVDAIREYARNGPQGHELIEVKHFYYNEERSTAH